MRKQLKIFEILDHPIWIKNTENNILFINSSFKKVFNIDIDYNEINLLDYLKQESEYNSLLNSILSAKGSIKDSFIYKNTIYKYNISSHYENDEKLLIGTILEDTELVNNNEKLMLRTVIDNIPSIIFYKDKNLRYMGINKACENFYNEKGVYEIIGKNDLEFPLEDRFKEVCFKHDKIILDTKEPLCIEEKVFDPIENHYTTFQTIKTPVINNKNEIIGLVGIVNDVTKYKLNEEKLTHLSYIDPLTSLYNRFYFDKKIAKYVKKDLFPVGIIFGDVNGLKLINDTFGHQEGDEFLIIVSKILKEVCTETETPFRFGGDEFCIVLPNASNEKCNYIMNKINECCSKKTYKNVHINISLGHSLLNKNGNVDMSLAEAEDKVYKQKMLSGKSIRISTLNKLKDDLHNKNIETEEHTNRVSILCEKVGKAMNLSDELVDELMLIGRLHDIGKISIPDYILLKPSSLTASEFEIMKTHSEKGYRLALLLPELSHISRAILTHHERWDGTGYPLELKGEEIPLIARIVAVVDSFDAMSNDRVYSKALSIEDSIEELKRCAGTQFDPNIVKVFCEIINKS